MAGDLPPTGDPGISHTKNIIVQLYYVAAGTKSALQVKFSLPSSSYATMALRELLIHDTSSSSQTQLNYVNKVD